MSVQAPEETNERSPGRPRGALIVTAIVVAAVGIITWRTGLWDGSGAAKGAVPTSGDAVSSTGLTIYPEGERPEAPELQGTTLDGEQLALSEWSGHVVVVNVWGSWCGPCRAEAPDLVRVARETADRGVRFLGIDTRDNPDAARAFVRSYGVPYPSLNDIDGQMLVNFNGIIPIAAVPSTVVIDPHGRVAARVVGKTDYTTWRGLIDDLLEETPTRSSAATGDAE